MRYKTMIKVGVIMGLMSMLGLGGCGKKSPDVQIDDPDVSKFTDATESVTKVGINDPSNQAILMRYIRGKYSEDEFEYVGVYDDSGEYDSQIVEVSSKNYPDETILIYRESTPQNTAFYDNYVAAVYGDDILLYYCDYFSDCMKTDDVQVKFAPDFQKSPSVNGLPTFEEFIASEDCGLVLLVSIGDAEGVVIDESVLESYFTEKGGMYATVILTAGDNAVTISYDKESKKYSFQK